MDLTKIQSQQTGSSLYYDCGLLRKEAKINLEILQRAKSLKTPLPIDCTPQAFGIKGRILLHKKLCDATLTHRSSK